MSPSPEDTRPPTGRRAVLGSVATALLAGGSGCFGLGSTDPPTSTETRPSPDGTGTTTPVATTPPTPTETPVDTPTAAPTDSPSSTRTSTSAPPSPIVEGLSDHVTPLETVDPSAPLDDLDPLSGMLSDATVVGLGEATHGTREFFQLKHRLVRFMVEEMGLRVFTWEAYFAESLAIDDYVRTGEGDPVVALDGIEFWTWDVQSVLSMIEWMRSYNEGRPEPEKVRVYGFDMQSESGPATAVREYVAENHPEFVDEHEATFEMLENYGISPYRANDPAGNVETTETFLRTVRDHLRANRSGYVAASSEDDWELTMRHVRIIEQKLAYAKAVLNGDGGESTAVRDRSMAENVAWIREFESADRVAAWGHNGHVGKSSNIYGRIETMGEHLAAEYGDAYHSVGQEFGYGAYRALSEPSRQAELGKRTVDPPPDGTIPAVLSDVDGPQFLLDVDEAVTDDAVADWLHEPRGMHSIGGVAASDAGLQTRTLADAFDSLTFVERTTKARPVGGR
jgi:erythromycin esterase